MHKRIFPTTIKLGLGDVLKSYDPVTRSLELELGDLKEHGLYRIVAVDHDLISFVDIQLPLDQIPKVGPVNELGLVQPITKDMKIIWPEQVQPAPSILVTNPKDARFSIPSKEPLHRIRHSSHIRFLVFSQGDYSKLKVELFIDNKPHLFAASFVGDTKTPLWTAPWNATLFEDKRAHQLRVQVTIRLAHGALIVHGLHRVRELERLHGKSHACAHKVLRCPS